MGGLQTQGEDPSGVVAILPSLPYQPELPWSICELNIEPTTTGKTLLKPWHPGRQVGPTMGSLSQINEQRQSELEVHTNTYFPFLNTSINGSCGSPSKFQGVYQEG